MDRLTFEEIRRDGIALFKMPYEYPICRKTVKKSQIGTYVEIYHRGISFINGEMRCPDCKRACLIPGGHIQHGDLFVVINEI